MIEHLLFLAILFVRCCILEFMLEGIDTGIKKFAETFTVAIFVINFFIYLVAGSQKRKPKQN